MTKDMMAKALSDFFAEEGVENEEEGDGEEDSLLSSLRGTHDATSYGGETQGISLINDIIKRFLFPGILF